MGQELQVICLSLAVEIDDDKRVAMKLLFFCGKGMWLSANNTKENCPFFTVKKLLASFWAISMQKMSHSSVAHFSHNILIKSKTCSLMINTFLPSSTLSLICESGLGNSCMQTFSRNAWWNLLLKKEWFHNLSLFYYMKFVESIYNTMQEENNRRKKLKIIILGLLLCVGFFCLKVVKNKETECYAHWLSILT